MKHTHSEPPGWYCSYCDAWHVGKTCPLFRRWAIAALCILFLAAILQSKIDVARAASDHAVTISGSGCRGGVATYTVSSWDFTTPAGLNPNVKVEYTYTRGNYVSQSERQL